MAIESTQFDYDSLTHGTKSLVELKTSEIRSRMGKAAASIIEIGERLIEVKKALPHGQFLPWLEAEFKWTEMTATKMMQVAKTFKSKQYLDLPIGTSALYLLASDATPQEVKDRFIHQAEQGEPVTHAEVKQAVKATRVLTKEEYEAMPEEEEKEPERLTQLNKAMLRATEAINILTSISPNDPRRAEALNEVARWIRRHK